MRYLAISVFATALALGLTSGNVWGTDVHVEAGVNLNGGAVDIGIFNDQLSPHGKWVEVAELGRVWQPNECATNAEWRPYLNDGHWVFTDDGWYWESTYPWGWAAFHYGRWNHDDKYNWVWSPDVTWAPAWVSWRQSDSVYGWAPLPFGARFEGGAFVGGVDVSAEFFNFVPAHSFLEVNLSTVAIPRAQAAVVFKETKTVNNSYTYNNNRVVNNGIPVQHVAAATKKEIKPAKVTDAKSATEKGQAGQVAAYRPEIKPAPAAKNGAAANPKAIEPKPVNTAVKPDETKAKPAEAKPETEGRSGLNVPADEKAKPEAKMPEPKAAEPRPAETKAKPAEPKPEEQRAVEPKPREPAAEQKQREPAPAPKQAEPRAKPEEEKPRTEEAKPAEPKGKQD